MKRILFYGDSNTFGYDPTGLADRYPADVRWVDIIADKLSYSLEVVPRGMNGRTIPASINEYELVDSTIKSASPLDYFGIMLGTNDILLTDSPDHKRTAKNMELLLASLKSAMDRGKYARDSHSGKFEIILINPPIIFPGVPKGSPMRIYEDESLLLAEEYRELARKMNLILIDAAKWNVELSFDRVHLSEAGSIDFAAKMESALKEIIL